MKKLKPKADRASIGHVWSCDQLITCKTVDLLELVCFDHNLDFDEHDINGTLENLLQHLYEED